MQDWLNYVGIAFGSALGGLSRYALARWADGSLGGRFPWGTLAVNVSGCFLIGFLASPAVFGDEWKKSSLGLTLVVGVCGGYTTFSAFGLQTLELLRAGATGEALQNVALSLLLCLGATWAGLGAGRLLAAG